MTSSDEAISALLLLPTASLAAIASALIAGTLRYGFSQNSLQPFCGETSATVELALRHFTDSGLTIQNLSTLCHGLASALAERDAAERSIQLVLSGPEVIGTPVVDTKTTVLSLFEEAQQEVLITSYVFHKASEIFAPLAIKHDANPNLQVTFIVDVSHSRKAEDETMPKLAQAFGANFRQNYWPGSRPPEIWHDPRCFEVIWANRGVLHAKTIVVDRKTAFVYSANFTEAAQDRNIEAGVLIRLPRIAERLHAYFFGLIQTNVLRRIQC
jgi:phosphatidylserine/phosphatidylglycerophosphate/cardiolipin synthase-like enzyme